MKALVTLLALSTAVTYAGGFELRTGLLYQDVPHLWSGFSREPSPAWNVELDWHALKASERLTVVPHLGATVAQQTSKVYGGAALEWSCKHWFVSIGLGVAVHDGQTDWEAGSERKALGSSTLFRIPVEAGYRHGCWLVSLLFEHTSNGYTANANEGMDSVGVRIGWAFSR